MEIDHVLIAVADVTEAADALWRDHGLAAVAGGHHEAWGTGNWIVPLGSSYLELVFVVDREIARSNAFGRRALAAIAAGGGPYAWCVRPADFDATVARLGLSTTAGSRLRPDGVRIAWRTAGMEVGLADPSRPFFIEWEAPPQEHPGRTVADHRVAPTEIARLEVRGDPAAVRTWLLDDARVTVLPGSPSITTVTISTAGGETVLG